MRKQIIFLFLAIFLISFVSSFGYDNINIGSFERDECVNLKQTCSNCTYVNITSISDSDSNVLIDQVAMEILEETLYNYTFCNTSVLGDYQITGFGDEDLEIEEWALELTITPTGNIQTEAQGISGAAYLLLMIVMTFLFIFAGFKLTDSELWPMGIFMFALSLFLIIYDFWLGYEYQLKYVGLDSSTAMPSLFFWFICFLCVVGLWVLILISLKKIPKLVKYIKWKQSQSEDPYNNDDF